MKITIEEDGKDAIIIEDVAAYMLASVVIEYGTSCLMTIREKDTLNNPNAWFQFLSCIKQAHPKEWAQTEKFYQPSEVLYQGKS